MEAIIAAINSDALKSAPSWLRVLEPFNTEFNEVRVFNKRWPDADKRAFLSTSTQFLRSTPDVSTADKAAFIRAIKIVTRDRSGLLELFSDENIAYFLGLFHEQPEPSAAATDLALELHYLLFNMIMLSREKVVKSIFEKGSHAVALRRAKDESSDLATRFSVLRILFVLTLDDNCANTLIAEHGIVPFLIKYMNELASDDPSALASPAFKERRKSLSECYKIVFNLIMETNRPSIADHVPKELFDSFGSLLGRVLAAGVTDMSVIEEEMRKREIAQRERAVELATIRKQEEANQPPEPEDDDPAMSEEIEPLPGESDAAFMARLMNPGGVRAKAADGAKDAASSASKPAQTAPTATPSPAAPATVAPVAAPAPAPVPAESKEELDPNTADLYSLKDAASHCLIYMPEALATYIDRDMRSVHALCELLAYHSRRDPKRLEEELAPVCMTLCGLVKHSLPARRYIKRFVFGWSSNKENVAEVIGTKVGIAPQDSDFADADPNSLKAVLLRSITTFHFTLKSQVSELLWLLCDESSGEYIRLAGFGNAAGLLAEKGLPGFAHLKTQAYDIDELLKARKKL